MNCYYYYYYYYYHYCYYYSLWWKMNSQQQTPLDCSLSILFIFKQLLIQTFRRSVRLHDLWSMSYKGAFVSKLFFTVCTWKMKNQFLPFLLFWDEKNLVAVEKTRKNWLFYTFFVNIRCVTNSIEKMAWSNTIKNMIIDGYVQMRVQNRFF